MMMKDIAEKLIQAKVAVLKRELLLQDAANQYREAVDEFVKSRPAAHVGATDRTHVVTVGNECYVITVTITRARTIA